MMHANMFNVNRFPIDPGDKGKLNIDGEIIGTSPVSVILIKGGVELII